MAFLTESDLTARTQRAVAAAVNAGRDLGMTVDQGLVLHDAFSVLVHLSPAPIVVRVPVALPVGLDLEQQRLRQKRELAVVSWLASQGEAVVAPSPLVAGPVQHDGFSMTFWERVDVDVETSPDHLGDVRHAARLHRALSACPFSFGRDDELNLSFLAPLHHTVPGCLEHLENHPELIRDDDLERALREWEILAPHLSSRESFEAAFPGARVQVIHGDAPSYNLIHTFAGPMFADFEDTTIGPIEWDLAGFPDEAFDLYDAAARDLGQAPLDRTLLPVMQSARALQTVASMALTDTLPQLATWLSPWLELWRKSPLAGGLANPR